MFSAKYIETHTRWLRRDLNLLEAWYEALADRDGRRVGAEFREAFRAAAVGEKVAPDEKQTGAHFRPFDAFTGFINEIAYGAGARQDLSRLFLARIHEGIHALQFKNAAALHADLFNSRARVIVCPGDYIKMREYAERDAHSKEVWLASLAAACGLLDAPDKSFSMMPVSEFTALADQARDLRSALAITAEAIMDKEVLVRTVAGAVKQTCRAIYAGHALRDYANGLAARRQDLQAGRLTFARLEPEDFRSVCNSFGPALYDQFEDRNEVAPALESRLILEQMESWLNIVDKSKLPFFKAALNEQGTNPAAFLAYSREAAPARGGVIAPKPLAYR